MIDNQSLIDANAVAVHFERSGVYSWREVFQFHRARNGIYHKRERLISLLTDFGEFNACYPDRFDESAAQIRYTGNGRRGDQGLSPSNRALLAAIETGHRVPLFCKIKVGQWRYEGLWRVIAGEYVFDENRERMIWRFVLQFAE